MQGLLTQRRQSSTKLLGELHDPQYVGRPNERWPIVAEYWVEGADKNSGVDVTIIVTAMDEEAAQAEAARRGVLVSKVSKRGTSGAAAVPSARGHVKPANGTSATEVLMSAAVAAGLVASVGYLWILYVIARIVTASIGSAGGGVRGAVGRLSTLDVTDALAMLVIPVAVPVVLSVLFQCLGAGMYGLRVRLLLLETN